MQSVSNEDLNQCKYLRTIPYLTYKNICPKICIGLNNGYVCNPLKSVEGSSADPIAFIVVILLQLEISTVGYHKIERCSCNLEMEKLEKIVSDYISLEDTGKKYNRNINNKTCWR